MQKTYLLYMKSRYLTDYIVVALFSFDLIHHHANCGEHKPLQACIVPSLNLSRFLHIAIATLGTFGIVWVPFAWSGGQQLIEQILYRIFPLQRGLFEVRHF